MKHLMLAASAAAALGLAGCGGGTGDVTPGTCIANVTSTNAQLIYPAPGATAVPGNIGQIVVAVNTSLPSQTNLALINTASGLTTQTQNFLTPISASQLPAGSATATISNPTYESVQLVNSLYVNFASGANVQVALNTQNYCTPTTIPNATFTLQ